MPVSLVCGLLSVNLMIRELGPADYGLVGLLFGIQLMLPFMDLGTAAGVLEGAARYRASGNIEDLAAPLRIAAAVTFLLGALVFSIVAAVAIGGWWPALLGRSDDPRLTMAVVAIFGINMVGRPLTQALNALVGLGRAVSVVMLQVLVPITSLAVVAIASEGSAHLAVYASSLVLGQLLCGLAALVLLVRTAPSLLQSTVRRKPAGIEATGLAMQKYAGPMLIITLLAPLGLSLDRLVLSHRSDVEALAAYALAAQIFQSAGSLVSAVQQALWAEFAARRARSDPGLSALVRRICVLLMLVGLVGGFVLWAVSPSLAEWVSGGEVLVSTGLMFFFAVTFTFQMASAGPGAALTTPRGLGQQAGVLTVAVTVNLAVTITFAPGLGAVAPAMGSAIGAVIQWALAYGLYRCVASKSKTVPGGIASTS